MKLKRSAVGGTYRDAVIIICSVPDTIRVCHRLIGRRGRAIGIGGIGFGGSHLPGLSRSCSPSRDNAPVDITFRWESIRMDQLRLDALPRVNAVMLGKAYGGNNDQKERWGVELEETRVATFLGHFMALIRLGDKTSEVS